MPARNKIRRLKRTGTFAASVKAYEAWMRAQLGSALVAKDLARKHEKMRESPFAFLRATYWRWAETVLHVLPDFATAPQVLCVGDIHAENFGTWRDVEGRLVWGINDFDEAARMPYALDLVRLGTSALLAADGKADAHQIARQILAGYRRGLADPQPIVIDRDWQWLRRAVVVGEAQRAKFWKKLATSLDKSARERPPAAVRSVLAAAMPAANLKLAFARRSAGAGSLGRPRWIAVAQWRGAPVVREAKALLPSAWTLAHGGSTRIRCAEAATGPHRAPDPWYCIEAGLVVRRLSPNNRKLEAAADLAALLEPRLLQAMGLELANVHCAEPSMVAEVRGDLASRRAGWLGEAMQHAAEALERDYASWRNEP